MNKMMSLVMIVGMGSLVGCLAEPEPGAAEEETVGEAASALTGHYCVRQSTASALRSGSTPPLECTLDPDTTLVSANAQLSLGHPLKALRSCLDPDYVFVQSLWNTSLYYMMRWDALAPC